MQRWLFPGLGGGLDRVVSRVDPSDLFIYCFDEVVDGLGGCLGFDLLVTPGDPSLTENRVESAAESGEMPVDGSASAVVGLHRRLFSLLGLVGCSCFRVV
jgi:hypothetical protein